MSVTFEAMILPALGEREAIEALNKTLYIMDAERHQQFNVVNMDTAGGTKFFTSDVYAACFNHFIPDDVEDCVRDAPWRYPEHVLYLVHMGDYAGDDDFGFAPRTIAQLREAHAKTGEQRPDFGEYHRCDRCGAKDRGQRDWGLDHARRCDGTVPRPPGWHDADASSRNLPPEGESEV